MTQSITKVTSDNVDAATLDTVSRPGSGNPTQLYVIQGQPGIDPLASGNSQIINEHTALSIPAYYSGVRFISETIAALPKHVYQRKGSIVNRVESHPMEWTLNDEPNQLQIPYTIWSTFVFHAVNWSNGYLAVKRNGSEVELFNLPPDRMIPFRFNGVQWFAFDLEKPVNDKPASRYLIFASDEIIHLPALSFDGMQGLSAVSLMASTLRVAKQTESYVGKYYENGGLMLGVIECEQSLTPDQRRDLEDAIRNKYSGIENANKWLVLGGGPKAKTLNPSIDSGQVAENRPWTVLEICRMLRIPPHVLYELGRATWNNVEHLGIEVVKYTLSNWITPIEQELTRKLLSRAERKDGCYVRFDTTALIRGDHAAQIEAAIKRVNNGLTTPDEERAVMELPPYADGIGSQPRISTNTVALNPEEAADETGQAPEAPGEVETPASDPEDVEGSDDLTKRLAPLYADAASRVETKTRKATDHAAANPGTNWTVWGNVFADQQAKYAADALQPVLEAAGKPVEAAAAIGQGYAHALRLAFAARARGEAGDLPSLTAIINDHMGGEK